METFVTIMLVTSMGLISGPVIQKGESCMEVGKFLMETDYITRDFGCFEWKIPHEVSLPERNAKR